MIKRPFLHWPKIFFPLLALSYFTSPYGWVFDQSILAPFQAMLVLAALSLPTRRRNYLLSGLVLLNMAALLYWLKIGQFQHEMWWPVVGLMGLGWLEYRAMSFR